MSSDALDGPSIPDIELPRIVQSTVATVAGGDCDSRSWGNEEITSSAGSSGSSANAARIACTIPEEAKHVVPPRADIKRDR
ncbi:uncharacterized protein N7482_000066 [Penicillium canariense]|uniref:Uncharacterized protein n=1 Tax=Penicillium canariense TaxID=189055 RepID=A0A9W9IAV9_9EURO|nr:uncharacterized protein N7482_000066 [Penicillium canariense]KAJ5174189.1 hypothetical protein N7482_000066 [Penicillium canariense]